MAKFYGEDIGLFENKNISDDNKDYITGMIITDGCIRSNGLYINLTCKDYDLISRIHECVCPNKKITKLSNRGFVCYQINWRNKNDIDYFVNIGVVPRKTYDIGIDAKNFSAGLMRGIFDGDGCVVDYVVHDKKYGRDYRYLRCSITTGSIKFANELSCCLKSVGIKTSIVKDNRHNTTYRITIDGIKNIRKFYDYIYSTDGIRLGRKKNIFDNYYSTT